ncbi:MAG: Gfo/Idh/MocA family oxidoreductase [Paenibacillus sp.]|uniref:Gfo/Idh/MocA family protein n=1 Tax=Paenibacillus sp. TaxID=58172 RepID=UPI0025F76142|nr:Gfo/Idh/MocA family oxidoreductase [Paenibacillus sp.]MBR2566335.1 Gfo/Idh/MocA family oxidoreductase [Paenibacillus sp.]
MKRLRIGMISFAHSHAFSYYRELAKIPHAEVVAIADDNRERVKSLLEQAHLSYYENYRDMLQLPDIDAVIICSENVNHASMVMESARAGKHILCEKPLGVSMDEMKIMIELCSKYGVELMTAFPCRYLPAVMETKRALVRGDIGQVVAVKGYNRGTAPTGWFVEPGLSGGGAILDHTVHIADLLRWLFNTEPLAVYAEQGQIRGDLEVEDSGMVHIEFDQGMMALIDTSWSRNRSYPFWGDVKLDIIGTEGVIHMDAFAQTNEVYSDLEVKSRWSYWGERMNYYMLEDFVDAINAKRVVPVTGEDGLRATSIALAAYESIKSKGKVVLQR